MTNINISKNCLSSNTCGHISMLREMQNLNTLLILFSIQIFEEKIIPG